MNANTSPANTLADYRALLEREYLNRRSRNAAYSVRSFARQLGVSKTALHEVMAQKRHLSRKNAAKVAAALSWSPVESENMLKVGRARTKGRNSSAELYLLDDTFRFIADWYHYAILNVIKLADHRASAKWMSERLGISHAEASEAILRLTRLGFITKVGNQFERTVGSLDTKSDAPTEAVKRYHSQNLRLAEGSLYRDSVDDREFSSLTVAIDAECLPRAKKMIRDFRARMNRELRSAKPDRVYQFSLQLFPLVRAGSTK